MRHLRNRRTLQQDESEVASKMRSVIITVIDNILTVNLSDVHR